MSLDVADGSVTLGFKVQGSGDTWQKQEGVTMIDTWSGSAIQFIYVFVYLIQQLCICYFNSVFLIAIGSITR